MSVHTQTNKKGVYFITFTCFNWYPLIEITQGYDLVYNWFSLMKKNGNNVVAYVIMPNHLHLILHYRTTTQSLNTIVGNGKRFIGYDIVPRLKEKDMVSFLQQMQLGVKEKDKQRNKMHQVWQKSFDVKECLTEKFFLQKLNYIHNNPCKGKWNLAPSPVEYLHSSAAYYAKRNSRHTNNEVTNILSELLSNIDKRNNDLTSLPP